MTPKRISVKLFTRPDPEAPVDLEPFIPLFHRFIQQASVEGLLIDVADYMHVPNGPGVVLVGHDVDYSLDTTGGRAGLLTVRKRAGDVPLAELLTDTLRKALVAARAIEADGSTKVRFATDALKIDVLDRLAVANEADASASLRDQVGPVLRELYGNAGVEVASGADDPRAALSLLVRSSSAPGIDELLARLPSPDGAEPAPPPAPPQTEWDVSVEQVKRLLEDGADFVLLDVREQREFEICEIGGRLIPLGTLGDRLAELDREAHIVVHCHTGGRSSHAVRAMRQAGFGNVWNLHGGIRAWIQRIDPNLPDY